MAATTFRGTVRMGSHARSSIGTPVLAMVGSFDPTSSTQVELFTLPKGAIPLGVHSLGGATGGTSPTVDVGSVGDDDGLAAGLDADGVAFNGSGALTGVELTVNTPVYGKVGSSAATGGSTTVVVTYVMAASTDL